MKFANCRLIAGASLLRAEDGALISAGLTHARVRGIAAETIFQDIFTLLSAGNTTSEIAAINTAIPQVELWEVLHTIGEWGLLEHFPGIGPNTWTNSTVAFLRQYSALGSAESGPSSVSAQRLFKAEVLIFCRDPKPVELRLAHDLESAGVERVKMTSYEDCAAHCLQSSDLLIWLQEGNASFELPECLTEWKLPIGYCLFAGVDNVQERAFVGPWLQLPLLGTSLVAETTHLHQQTSRLATPWSST